MRKVFWYVLALVLIAPQVQAEPELTGRPSELSRYLADIPQNVTLAGSAEIKVQADRAVVTLRVLSQDASLSQALKANQDLRATLRRALTQAGIPDERIIGSKFSSTPNYRLLDKKPSSYRVVHILMVSVDGEREFQEVARLIDTHREVEYEGLAFEHTRTEELKQQALAQACAELIRKQGLYERTLRITLTPKSFHEGDVIALAPRGRQLKEAAYEGMVSGTALSTPEEAPPSFGELTYRSNITAEFVLKPAGGGESRN